MIVLHNPDTLLHETIELLGARVRPALESPARIQAIILAINESSRHELRTLTSPIANDLKRLLDVVQITHKPDYLEHIQNAHGDWVAAQLIGPEESILPECFVFSTNTKRPPKRPKDIYARAGYYAIDMSSGIMDKTFASIIASANLALEASVLVGQGQAPTNTVVALCRPPGHHCDGARAGGYCYINQAAVAVTTWREQFPNTKAGIIDLDFHHGNGTQDIFYNDPHVLYCSIHGEDEFPYYTGAADEQGGENAVGANLNLPLKPGSSFPEYLAKLDVALAAFDDFKVEFLAVSLGFDTFHLDPLGSFQIETESYATIAGAIKTRLGQRPAVIMLEGGYNVEHIGQNLVSFLKGWEEAAATLQQNAQGQQ